MASFTSTLRAVLTMDTRAFQAGATRAEKTLKQLREKLGAAGAGSLTRFLGIGLLVTGFTQALNRAQELRDEAARLGTALDPSVRRTAELADNFDRLKSSASDIGVSIVGGLAAYGDFIGTQYARLFGLLKGQSVAKTDERIRISETAGANADRLERERADPAVDRNIAERDRLREAARRKELNDFDLLNQLEKDRDALRARAADLGLTLAQRTQAQVDLEKKLAEIVELRAAMQKRSDDEREAAAREAERAAAERARAESDRAKAAAAALDDIIERTEAALKAERDYADAVAASKRATDDLATANRDRVAFGVDAAASGGRGTSEEQRRARRIRQLEEEAARAYDRGGRVTERRDQKGNVIRETGEQEAARKLAEADALRGGFGNRLASGERDPLAAQKQNLQDALEAAKVLQDIRDSLRPETIR